MLRLINFKMNISFTSIQLFPGDQNLCQGLDLIVVVLMINQIAQILFRLNKYLNVIIIYSLTYN
jgi:hypothetical protein